MVPAFNAKLSEYHAAVGHAALDEWPDARAEWLAVAARYRAAFAGLFGCTPPRGIRAGLGIVRLCAAAETYRRRSSRAAPEQHGDRNPPVVGQWGSRASLDVPLSAGAAASHRGALEIDPRDSNLS